MVDTQLALKTSKAHSEQQELNPLQKTIISMVKAMRSDYGAVYKNTFSTPEELQLYKQRLYAKLKDLPLESIFEGYENCVANNTKFCPTVPEIVGATLAAVKRKAKEDAKTAEFEKLAALPPPKPRYMQPTDILAMMRDALKAPEGTESARLERLKAARESHESLLDEHYKAGKIRRVVSERHSCCRCNKPGTLSADVSGNGHWYCVSHYTG